MLILASIQHRFGNLCEERITFFKTIQFQLHINYNK
jgi:hypothetical protein